mgnify:CR=1 FL=1
MATAEVRAFFDATEVDDVDWPNEDQGDSLDPDQQPLVSAVKLDNRRIFRASIGNRSVQGMGTTIVGALFNRDERKLHIAHVGVSRAYRVRAG